MPTDRTSLLDLSPRTDDFRADVLRGLVASRKQLAPKYFYDAVGSSLFDAICGLQEYYPTRTETALLRDHMAGITRALGESSVLIEYGSGLSHKSQLLIEAARPSVYVPIDISRDALTEAINRLSRLFPRLAIAAVCADYSRELQLPTPENLRESRRNIFFPGSTIGNFDPEESVAFLANAARTVGAGGGLLIGVDLRKDKLLLDAAYDDPQGVTAAFNLNLLARINRELGANFNIRAFRHFAEYVESLGRIEMHLVSTCDQTVTVAGQSIEFKRGETIHTENSYKYTVEGFQALAKRAGFHARECWIDERKLFSVHYMHA